MTYKQALKAATKGAAKIAKGKLPGEECEPFHDFLGQLVLGCVKHRLLDSLEAYEGLGRCFAERWMKGETP